MALNFLFKSTQHTRFQNGIAVSEINTKANREISVEQNISGTKEITVSIFNLDGNHPLWNNNIQIEIL